MALWGKKDVAADKPKFVKLAEDGTLAQDASGKKLVLIDSSEANLSGNKAKGITGPGWYLVHTVGTRTKVELLIALADAPRVVDEEVLDESDADETSVGVGSDPA